MDAQSESGSSGGDSFEFVRKAVKQRDDLEDPRAEFSTVDYSPATNIRPVDFVARLRPTRTGRKIR